MNNPLNAELLAVQPISGNTWLTGNEIQACPPQHPGSLRISNTCRTVESCVSKRRFAILVVDDSDTDRFSLCQSLNKIASDQLDITEVNYASAAVKTLEEKDYDAILLYLQARR